MNSWNTDSQLTQPKTFKQMLETFINDLMHLRCQCQEVQLLESFASPPPSVVKAVLFKKKKERKKETSNNFLHNILYLKLVVGQNFLSVTALIAETPSLNDLV